MKAHVFTGSKQEIAQKVANLQGEVREAIVFMEEPASTSLQMGGSVEDMFAEMKPYTVQVGDVDDSREAIYSRMPGE